MTWRLRFLLILACLTASFAQGQANIEIPCPVTQKILPDGTMQAVDCNGRPVGSPKPLETPSPKPAHETSTLTSTDVKLPADAPAAKAYQKYLEAYYNYQSHSLGYAESVFEWQYKSSKVIFYVVILLVLSGLAFAAIQFAIAMRVPLHPTAQKTSAKNDTDNSPQMGTTTFEASPQGVKITSSVIGLLILVVSIGFFYLYLVYVYPIQNIAK